MRKKGFSLAEMLIVMLVLAIVAGATAPMIMPKKKKDNAAKFPHGIFECYYDANGDLWQYQKDNKRYKKGGGNHFKVTGDSCTFTVPEANYYKVQLIGAGGRGSESSSIRYTQSTITGDNGTIKYTELNKSSIPQWVIDNWYKVDPNGNPPTAELTIEGPQGLAGANSCRSLIRVVNFTSEEFQDFKNRYPLLAHLMGSASMVCNILCAQANEDFCPSACVVPKHCTGGAAAPAAMMRANIPIHIGDKIEYPCSADDIDGVMCSLTINPAYFYSTKVGNFIFKESEDGGDAEEYDIHANPACIDGVNRSDNLTGYSVPDGYEEYVRPLQNDHTKPFECGTSLDINNDQKKQGYVSGTVRLSPNKITYSRKEPYFLVYTGANGNSGVLTNFTFPNLGGKTLTITPAKVGDEKTIIKIGDQELISSPSGEATNKLNKYKRAVYPYIEDDYKTISHGDFIDEPKDFFPVKYHTDKFNAAKARVFIGEVDPLYPSKISGDINPGIGGVGQYPYLGPINYTYTYTIGDKNTTENKTVNNAEIKCLDGSEPEEKTTGKFFCNATNGNPGAVRIVW